jgi:formylglycine-generating enzyme required for sulfatase activity
MRRWFLSYTSQDLALTQALQDALKRKDPAADIFFAPESMRAGGFWKPQLAKEIEESTAFILLIGEKLGDWQVMEYYEALDRRAKEPDYPIILILSAKRPAPGLPFARQLYWVTTEDPASEATIGKLLDAASGPAQRPSEVWRFTRPYRGLEAMTEANSDYFFGRDRKTVEVIDVLAAAPAKLPILLGNSGVGKSSLAQAGVLAALLRQGWSDRIKDAPSWPEAFHDSRRWCFLTLRPGMQPLQSLVALFFDTWQYTAASAERVKEEKGWIELLRDGKAALPDLLTATERRHKELGQTSPPAFFLYIDQGEELYVRAEEREWQRFSEILAHGLGHQHLRALMSMRSDFLGELQGDELLFGAHRQINVPPLREPELREVVSRPAELLSARFETESLVAMIARRTAEESAKDAGALPLLSYLLDDMWTQMVQRGDGVLRLPEQAFELGSVLVRRANAFVSAHPDSEDKLRRIFTLKLATVREGEEPTRRRAWRSEFSEDEWKLVSALADHPNRLLVTATPEGSETYAEVAHEAIFRRWEKLRDWITAEREFLAWRTGLEAARRAWWAISDNSKSDALLMGAALTQAQSWLAKRRDDLSAADRDFIDQSTARERKTRWRRVVGTAGAVVALLGIAALLWAGFVAWGVWTNEAEMEFAPIPAGCFQMGSPDTEDGRYTNEGPVVNVCLKAFELGKFEVTQAQWRRVMVLVNPGPSDFKGDESRPVEQVSWNEAQFFVRLMSFFGGHHYRLPSEAEWEYASRAGTTTARYWGERVEDGCPYENMADLSLKTRYPNFSHVLANLIVKCDDGHSETSPVGSFKPNLFRLHDMLGNVSEWVEDCYVNNYSDAKDGSAVTALDCASRVVRGGSWYESPRVARAANRIGLPPSFRNNGIGLRLARTVAP